MSYGVKISNGKGDIIIDDSYRNAVYLRSIRITATWQNWVALPVETNVWYVFEPLIDDVDSVYIVGCGPKPTRERQYRFISDCIVHIFGFADQPSSLTWGLRIYNAQSHIVFDGGLVPFNVVDYIKGTLQGNDFDTAADLPLLDKVYQKERVGILLSKGIQGSATYGGNFYTKAIRFKQSRDTASGGVRVTANLSTVHASGKSSKLVGSVGFMKSFINSYSFSIIDCTALPPY